MHSNLFLSAKIVLTVLGLMAGASTSAQSIHGYVRELGSMEPLINATVYDSISAIRCQSNEFGYFTLNLRGQKSAVIKANFPGFSPKKIDFVHLNGDTSVNILLSSFVLNEVEIVATTKTEPPALGLLTISKDRLFQLPSIGGVPDLLKALGTLPGVSNGGELFTGLLVRGGNDDQNLYLLDGAPIYGTTHLFNIVSLYNAEAIKKAQLYKGVFPARFGGRVASVLDVNFREGNKKRLQGNFSLGILNSSFLLEGPLGKAKKMSFLLAGRATYLDLLTIQRKRRISRHENGSDNYNGLGFFDLNARFNYEINDRNKFFLNCYYGNDHQKSTDQNILVGFMSNNFADISQTKQSLENLSICARYSNVVSEKLFLHYTISFNQYLNNIKNTDKHFGNRDSLFFGNIVDERYLKSNTAGSRFFGGKNLAGRAEMLYAFNPQHQFRAGVESVAHQLSPGAFESAQWERDDDGTLQFNAINAFGNPTLHSFENALYVEDEMKLLKQRLTVHPGIRMSHFSTSNQAAFDPRLSLEYKMPNGSRFSAAIGYTTQFLHTLNGDANRIDKSIWVSSSEKFPAQRARMLTGAYATSIPGAKSTVSVELFHRKMSDLTTFKFNPDDAFTYADWEKKFIGNGTGKSYGMDLLWSTTLEHFSTSIGYTLSWNTRKFDLINNGDPFPAKYDRRHDLKIASAYAPKNSKWSFGATWFFNTGHRYTIPVGTVASSPIFGGFPAYDGINNVRMPNYHRLDLMARWTHTPKKGWLKQYAWSFDALNAYNRKNPYGLVLKSETQTGPDGQPIVVKKLKGVAILPILPSITFRANF